MTTILNIVTKINEKYLPNKNYGIDSQLAFEAIVCDRINDPSYPIQSQNYDMVLLYVGSENKHYICGLQNERIMHNTTTFDNSLEFQNFDSFDQRDHVINEIIGQNGLIDNH